jgi:hypothetical protein
MECCAWPVFAIMNLNLLPFKGCNVANGVGIWDEVYEPSRSGDREACMCYPHVFVADPHKHDCFRRTRPRGNSVKCLL